MPIERHDTLHVQIALMFSLISQLEDISGAHRFTVTRFAKHDIFIFGNQELHIFVITSPTSEEQVVKTLAELVATMNEADPQMAGTSFVNSTKDRIMATTMASTTIRRDEHDIRRKPNRHPKPEIISVLQGYLMAIEQGYTIQDDAGSHYKIKASDNNQLSWSSLQKITRLSKSRIEIHDVGVDAMAMSLSEFR